MTDRPFVAVVDFDGTVVMHDFPRVGDYVPGSVAILRKMQRAGVKIVLNTMRSGEYLDAAVEWFKENGIELYGINENPDQKSWTSSPKVYGNIMIDDMALGAPLRHEPMRSPRPFIDWRKVDEYFHENGFYVEPIVKKESRN
jgi:hypothetical protein